MNWLWAMTCLFPPCFVSTMRRKTLLSIIDGLQRRSSNSCVVFLPVVVVTIVVAIAVVNVVEIAICLLLLPLTVLVVVVVIRELQIGFCKGRSFPLL